MKLLPFRPLPEEGELFKAYVLRLCMENERHKLSELLKIFKISPVAKKVFVVGTNESSWFMGKLTIALNLKGVDLTDSFKQEKAIQMLDWLSSRHIMVNEPVICPQCVVKLRYLKADWHLYYQTHCLEHECKLWKSCPQCGNKFDWHTRLFRGCTSCELRWENISVVKAKCPPSQKTIAKSTYMDKKNISQNILRKLKVGLRPFDASFQKLRDIDKFVPELDGHIETAYALCTSKKAVKELRQQRINHWQNLVGGPMQSVILKRFDAANDDFFNEVDESVGSFSYEPIQMREADYQILSPHRRINSSASNACLDVSWAQLKDVLKISESTIKNFIRSGILPGRMHLNCKARVSPSRIDDVVAFFRKLKGLSLPLATACNLDLHNRYIAWGDETGLAAYKVNTAELINLVIENEVAMFSPKYADHGFDEFYFCKRGLLELFGAHSANDDLVLTELTYPT